MRALLRRGKNAAYMWNASARIWPWIMTAQNCWIWPIRASVDGIIVTGDDEEETVELIDEAVDAGIPVVTILSDCIESRRQCFVGSNNYNIGQEYGRQILKHAI